MSSIDFYVPYATTKEKDQSKQAILTQVLLPQLSNNGNKGLVEFFKGKSTTLNREFLNNSNKIVSLNSAYGCDLETHLRFMWSEKREKHIEFMQNIKPQQLAALVPYARFYVTDNAVNSPKAALKNAIPISFDKSFDTNYFKKNINNTSRGEGAGIKSISVSKAFNITADYDPITLNASFFFSSYDVLINKPAIDREYLFGLGYGGSRAGAATRRWNFQNFSLEEIKDMTYKELLTISTTGKFRLFLEYGWSVPEGVSSALISPSEKALIEDFEKVYYAISPVTHNINFSEDGSFSLDVEYVPVPIRTLTETSDFKSSFFSDKKLFNSLRDELKIDHPDLIDEIEKRQKKIHDIKSILEKKQEQPDDVHAALKLEIIKLEDEIKRLAPGQIYTKAIIQALHKQKKYTLKYSIEQRGGEVDDKTYDNKSTDVFVKISRITALGESFLKDIDLRALGESTKEQNKLIRSTKFKKTYEIKPFKKKMKNYASSKRSSSAALDAAKQILKKSDLPEFLQNSEQVSHVLKNLLPDTRIMKDGEKKGFDGDEYAAQIEFVFLKDFLDLIYQFVDHKDGRQLPVCILGNIAAPLPNGYKYWCNIGDIPLEMTTLMAALSNFFRTKPNGSLVDLLHYIFQTVVPKIMTNSSTVSDLPTISFPYFHFEATKWLSDSKVQPILLNKLLRGDAASLLSLSTGYFSDSAFGSGLGCIFVGQTSSLQYENSNVFISKRMEAFSQSFFKNEPAMTKNGISKLVIGASGGLLISMNFNSNTDPTIKNLNDSFSRARSGADPRMISANFQYTMNATLFGSRIHEFSNLVFVPSYSLGKANPSIPKKEPKGADKKMLINQLKTDDFEIGGLYQVANVTDTLDLVTNTYRKVIVGNTVLRESRMFYKELTRGSAFRQSAEAKRQFPALADTSLSTYVVDNADGVDMQYLKKPLLTDKELKRMKLTSPVQASAAAKVFKERNIGQLTAVEQIYAEESEQPNPQAEASIKDFKDKILSNPRSNFDFSGFNDLDKYIDSLPKDKNGDIIPKK